jgi:excisionase family DNA binding protein
MTYTPRELAAELKIPHRLVFIALREKKLTMMKFSSATFRISGSDVDAWLESLKK